MHFLDNLNPEQRDAVLRTEGPLLILAGAGSGKTRVIAYRVAHLIGSGRAAADEVLAVTFTNKAAEEMRGRVEALLSRDCRGMWISTFHALCARLLRREARGISLSNDFVIYDTADQLALMKQVIRDLKIDDKLLAPRVALARISHAKNRMQIESLKTGWGYRDEQIAAIYEAYRQRLAESGALDFDDLLLKTVELFETRPDVAERYGRRFRFQMVDEYQDTNRPQYLLVRQLARLHRNLCVVGDPDQSIYAWRGADLRNIMAFEEDFPEAQVVRLERNYRSTQVILDAASAVISRNVNRKEKRLWTDRKGGTKIGCFLGNDDLEEADYISRAARLAVAGDPGASVAILYRTNAQSRVIEDALRRENIRYRIVGNVRFYERREVKDALAYLKLLINPHDEVSLRRVINVPARGIGKAVIDAVERVPVGASGDAPLPGVTGGEPATLWRRLTHGLDEGRFTGRAAASLAAFRDLVLQMTDVARSDAVSTAVGKVLDRTGYLQHLHDEHSEEAEGRIENLAELVSAAREYETREPTASLAGFVDRLSLLSEADEEQGAPEARVWMMTLHAAKGLEFPTVIIAGLEERLFPHARSSDEPDDLEEERRLCYVGMTRAQSRLLLTGAARRRVFGEYQASAPSRFIDEVPPELIEYETSPYFEYGGRGLGGNVRRPDATAGWRPDAASGRPAAGAPYAGRRAEVTSDGSASARPPATSGRGRGRRVEPGRASEPASRDEEEDQSMPAVRPGTRVRHAQFGVGTVVSVEALDDDMKVTVRFASVGQKKLLARYARLEVI